MRAFALLNSLLQHPESSSAEAEAEATLQARHSPKPLQIAFTDLAHAQEQGLCLEQGVGSHPDIGLQGWSGNRHRPPSPKTGTLSTAGSPEYTK